MSVADEDIFTTGDVIDSRFQVIRRLGRGGYGEIYACKNNRTGEPLAVKVERASKPGNLLDEELILSDLNSCDCKYVPKVFSSGKHENKVNYIAMNLLGDNLSVVRRRQPSSHYSLLTTLMLGMQMLRSIREVHDAGYLHRDIKPGNFVLGTKRTNNYRKVIIIDFGLSKRHLYPDGSVKAKSKTSRWVGSRRYMSLNTHLRKDQGRRDDLWSLFYVIIEFCTGTLPWAHLRGIQNLDKVRDMKQTYYDEKLVRGLPGMFLEFMNYLKTLKYESHPDYDFLHSIMLELFKNSGGMIYLVLGYIFKICRY
eukprot:TRINITY_DN5471_c0_g1_i4.p1 TRINITY_DN5471_c0_g1~~TRINITY_DN5471_c0_g1_i4.p1  ORF type:complete len:316 (-),score=49.04 TRINITY_DN5471_c0_g1_i4:265-1191(-)